MLNSPFLNRVPGALFPLNLVYQLKSKTAEIRVRMNALRGLIDTLIMGALLKTSLAGYL